MRGEREPVGRAHHWPSCVCAASRIVRDNRRRGRQRSGWGLGALGLVFRLADQRRRRPRRAFPAPSERVRGEADFGIAAERQAFEGNRVPRPIPERPSSSASPRNAQTETADATVPQFEGFSLGFVARKRASVSMTAGMGSPLFEPKARSPSRPRLNPKGAGFVSPSRRSPTLVNLGSIWVHEGRDAMKTCEPI